MRLLHQPGHGLQGASRRAIAITPYRTVFDRVLCVARVAATIAVSVVTNPGEGLEGGLIAFAAKGQSRLGNSSRRLYGASQRFSEVLARR